MTMEQTVNANIAHCVKSINQIGSTAFKNICNGTEQTVPWGSADWMLFIGLAIGAVVIIGMFAAMAIMTIRDF